MDSINGFLRRILPNRSNLRSNSEFSFELLRSASARELKKCANSKQNWPRRISDREHFHMNSIQSVSVA
ncbi:unnamed protein product [Thelazia callipaeda]|uniref:Uncharacterized protein n=1 Tax=Thelazia callipaeda TaxID=103827 RepID=A0A0N5DAD9_THECL|nr:unnamed protein product [Thelazia callipaeda]